MLLNLDIQNLDILIESIEVSKRQNSLAHLDNKVRNKRIKEFLETQGFQTMTVHQT